MNLTIEAAKRVLEIVDAGLVLGLGEAKPGKLCVEAAVCLALGEEHGDEPSCVAAPDRAFKIRLNDSIWSSPAARAKGLRRLSVMQLGTARTDRSAWLKILVELTIRRVVPEALEMAAKRCPIYSERIREAARRCANDGTLAAALAARDLASAAYAAAYAASAASAADVAASAAYAAAYAASAASAADAAASAASAADADAVAYAERDRIFTIGAKCAEEAYELTGSIGTELLMEIEKELK